MSVLLLELNVSLWAGKMEGVDAIANVVARGALQSAAAASSAAATVTTQPACASDNDYDGRIGVRVSAIFVILVGSMFGTLQQSISNALPIWITNGLLQGPPSQSTRVAIKA